MLRLFNQRHEQHEQSRHDDEYRQQREEDRLHQADAHVGVDFELHEHHRRDERQRSCRHLTVGAGRQNQHGDDDDRHIDHDDADLAVDRLGERVAEAGRYAVWSFSTSTQLREKAEKTSRIMVMSKNRFR